MDNLQVLKEARVLIQKGWTRGQYKRDGRYCAIGAVREVVQSSDAQSHQITTLVDMLNDFVNEDGTVGLSFWNDKQKTKKPVLELFDRAIAHLGEYHD